MVATLVRLFGASTSLKRRFRTLSRSRRRAGQPKGSRRVRSRLDHHHARHPCYRPTASRILPPHDLGHSQAALLDAAHQPEERGPVDDESLR